MEEYHGQEITVRYEVPLKAAAMRLASAYGAARTDVEAKLGWRLQISPVVVLVRDHYAFQETARNELVTAFAKPERNLIVIDYSKMNRTPLTLKTHSGMNWHTSCSTRRSRTQLSQSGLMKVLPNGRAAAWLIFYEQVKKTCCNRLYFLTA